MNRREALTTGSYGIITGLDNTVTAVISRRLIAVYESSAATFKPPATESVSAALPIMSARSSPHFPSLQYGTDACKQFPETEWFYQ
jgi:hypothetical protein